MNVVSRSRLTTSAVVVIVTLGVGAPVWEAQAAPRPTIRSAVSRVGATVLPGLPGASGATKARAINGAGTVVGSATNAGGVVHAVVWRGTTITDLDRRGKEPSAALAVNGSGQIVGTTGMSFHNSATLWQGGRTYLLPAPPDPSPADFIYGCAATSINDAGLIGGYCDVDVNTSVVGLPVIWRDKSPIVAWSRGAVLSVNDRGHLAGWFEHGYNGEGLRAVLSDDSGLHELPALGGSLDGDQAFAVNRRDLVVGQSDGRPVAWRHGMVHGLRAPSGSGAAFGVNTWGTIVGTEGVTARPVMWKSGVLLPLSRSGGAAAAVNDRGLVAGWVVRGDGTTGAIRWRVTGTSGARRSMSRPVQRSVTFTRR